MGRKKSGGKEFTHPSYLVVQPSLSPSLPRFFLSTLFLPPYLHVVNDEVVDRELPFNDLHQVGVHLLKTIA